MTTARTKGAIKPCIVKHVRVNGDFKHEVDFVSLEERDEERILFGGNAAPLIYKFDRSFPSSEGAVRPLTVLSYILSDCAETCHITLPSKNYELDCLIGCWGPKCCLTGY
jgi:hypothetical protein